MTCTWHLKLSALSYIFTRLPLAHVTVWQSSTENSDARADLPPNHLAPTTQNISTVTGRPNSLKGQPDCNECGATSLAQLYLAR